MSRNSKVLLGVLGGAFVVFVVLPVFAGGGPFGSLDDGTRRHDGPRGHDGRRLGCVGHTVVARSATIFGWTYGGDSLGRCAE